MTYISQMKKFILDQSGAIAPLFAVLVPLLVGAVGMGVDVAQAYLVKERLSHALDAAALAAAASETDQAGLQAKLEQFMEVNYPEEKIGATVDLQISIDGDLITASASAQYSTIFMRVLGIETIDVEAETGVQRQVRGIEVAMVLDVTGSMASNNNIATLREAASDFVNILFNGAGDDQMVKIGLVPYSTSVNVGPYGLGTALDGSYYGDAFVENPMGLNYSAGSSSQWGGCILENDYPDDVEDNEGPWEMYRWCRNNVTDNPVCDYTYNSRRRTYTPRNSPNYICPRTPIMPLSNDREGLLDAIDDLEANGNTLGNVGMVWGLRVLTPEFPFEEGAEWDSEYWSKSLVIMTDGVAVMHPYYSAYGPTDDHRIDNRDLDERLSEICENAKDMGITVYTITFTGGINQSTKDRYEACASGEDQYHDAPDQDDLRAAFQQIAREISNLHITY